MQVQIILKKHVFLMALSCVTFFMGAAQARSGRAAYHYHTGEMITASRYEPIGSVLRVTNPQNGRAVTVRVAGSGPYNGNRILDLSTGAFSALYGGLGRGHGPVSYEVVSRGGGGGVRLASRGGGWRALKKRSAHAKKHSARRAGRKHRRYHRHR